MKEFIYLKTRTVYCLSGINTRFFICSILFSVFFLGNSTLYAQKRFMISPGISYKWSINESEFESGSEDIVVSDGNKGFLASLGFFWLDDSEISSVCRVTYENYKSTLQNWQRVPIGSMTANVFRIDPVYIQYHIKESKFIYNFNIAGISVFTGNSVLLPDSYCYNEGSWYLIHKMHVNNSIGWSLIGLGFDYEFNHWLSAGIETVMIEEDRINVIFLTDIGDIESDVNSVNSFFPVKFKLIIKL